jgi:hypothetical protein
MTSLSTQLQRLHDGRPKKVRGVSVCKENGQYIIDDEHLTLDEAVKVLEGRKRQKFPYDQVAFLLVKPPSRVISSHQIKNRKEHAALLEKAKEKKYVVYYADVKKQDGKFFAVQPWIVDFESVDNLYGPVEELGKEKPDTGEVEDKDEIRCPFCKKKMSSTPGRTLHVKSKHPDKYEEYMKSK